MRNHLKDVTELVCDEHVRTCGGHASHRRSKRKPPEAGASSLHSESSKDGGVAAVGLGGEVAGAGWGSPGCSTQSPELRSDLCRQWEAFGESEAGVQQDPVTV